MKIIQAKLREILELLESDELDPSKITDEQDVVISKAYTEIEDVVEYCDRKIIEAGDKS